VNSCGFSGFLHENVESSPLKIQEKAVARAKNEVLVDAVQVSFYVDSLESSKNSSNSSTISTESDDYRKTKSSSR
jgi:hypothetical protein